MEIASGDFIVENGGDDVSDSASASSGWSRPGAAGGGKALVVHSDKRDVDPDGNPIETLQMLRPARRPDAARDGAEEARDDRRHHGLGRARSTTASAASPTWRRTTTTRSASARCCSAARTRSPGSTSPWCATARAALSRHEVQSYGYWWFFGDRIRYMRFDLDLLPELPPRPRPAAAARPRRLRRRLRRLDPRGRVHDRARRHELAAAARRPAAGARPRAPPPRPGLPADDGQVPASTGRSCAISTGRPAGRSGRRCAGGVGGRHLTRRLGPPPCRTRAAWTGRGESV